MAIGDTGERIFDPGDALQALTRPGRIGLTIEVGLPDQESREAIVRMVFADSRFAVDREVLDKAVDIARALEGLSGAEIVDVGNRIKENTEWDGDELVEHPRIGMADVDCVLADEGALKKSFANIKI